MMEADDKLIRDLFTGQKKEIADGGFTSRVMKNLPHREGWFAKAWSIFITCVALTLFFVFDGLEALIGTLREVFVSMVQNSAANFDPKSLLLAVVVLLFLGIRKVWSMN